MEPAARTRAIKVVAIDEDSAVGDVAVMIEKDTVVIPIRSPVVPTPAKPAKEADAKAETKRKTRTCKVQSRIPIPAWPDPDRLSIDEPRIVLRHVNNLSIRIQCDRRDGLLQVCRRLLRGLNRWL